MKKRIVALTLALMLLAALSTQALASVPCVWCNFYGGRSACKMCHGTGRVGSDPRKWEPAPPSSGGSSGSTSGFMRLVNPDDSKVYYVPDEPAMIDSTSVVAGHSKDLYVYYRKGKVKWSSSNKRVATVTTYGEVKGVKPGKCTITAKVDGVKLKCKVTVKKPVYAKSIKLDKKKVRLMVGDGVWLQRTVAPDPESITEDYSVTWSSSNPSVASVEDLGVVSTLKPGKATITAKLKIKKGAYKKAKCVVTVESGVTIFKRWFNKNATTFEDSKQVMIGAKEWIGYNLADKFWYFHRQEETKRNNGVSIVQVQFNEDFTGNAGVYYYWGYEGLSGLVELECETYVPVKEFAPYYSFKWQVKKGKDTAGVASSDLRNMMSVFDGLLRQKVGLTVKGGWRDLGLTSYTA